MCVPFDVHPEGYVPELPQCQITEVIDGSARAQLRSTDVMTQGGQMDQTCDTASPNCLSTTAISQRDESFQVSHQAVAESLQVSYQLMT